MNDVYLTCGKSLWKEKTNVWIGFYHGSNVLRHFYIGVQFSVFVKNNAAPAFVTVNVNVRFSDGDGVEMQIVPVDVTQGKSEESEDGMVEKEPQKKNADMADFQRKSS